MKSIRDLFCLHVFLLMTILSVITLLSARAHANPVFSFHNANYSLELYQYDDVQVVTFEGTLAWHDIEPDWLKAKLSGVDNKLGLFDDLSAIYKLKEHLIKGKSINFDIYDGEGGGIAAHAKLAKVVRSACPIKSLSCIITTKVVSGCASACIRMFMIGDRRVARRDSLFIFHDAWFIHPSLIYENSGDALTSLGANREWINKHRQLFSKQKGTPVEAKDLLGSGIVTELNN